MGLRRQLLLLFSFLLRLIPAAGADAVSLQRSLDATQMVIGQVIGGGEEWGRRNDVGSNEGRRRFHGIKQADKGQGGGKGLDDYGTNPDTGDVVNPQGEVVGNLGDR